MNRPRAYSVVTLNELIQKKPYHFGVELLEKVAFCNLMLKGSVFLRASEEEVGDYMNGLAERRSLPERVDGALSLSGRDGLWRQTAPTAIC